MKEILFHIYLNQNKYFFNLLFLLKNIDCIVIVYMYVKAG